MARTALTPTEVGGPYSGSATAFTWTAADAVNKNEFTLTGEEIILIHNTDGANPHNVTLSSVDDERGRQEDVTEAVAASAYMAFPATALTGWIQTDGKFYLEADDAQIEFAILRLP